MVRNPIFEERQENTLSKMDIFSTKKRIVIKDRNRQMEITRDAHSGIRNSERSKAMASHRGKNSMYEKIAQRYFWYNISSISDFVRKCEQCQKQSDLKSANADLKPIPIPSTVMKQVGVVICNLQKQMDIVTSLF